MLVAFYLSSSVNPTNSKTKVGSEEGKMLTALPLPRRNREAASSEIPGSIVAFYLSIALITGIKICRKAIIFKY
ncbi:hypothetical protein HanPI659440_Chr01g0011121 [Helianthus annuus]|nr:hypothetical protein HanPI659440_Chr01g0011121 [Helianthus annuus]